MSRWATSRSPRRSTPDPPGRRSRAPPPIAAPAVSRRSRVSPSRVTRGTIPSDFVTANLSVISGTVKIKAKPAKLLLATPPSSTAASGIAIPTQPVIQIADKNGQPVEESGATVTAVIASGPAGASLSGATAVSDGSGAAAFSSLSITGVVGTYTLRFSSGTLTSVTSGNIALGAGAPATVTMVNQPPSSVQNDGGFSNNPEVRVQDGTGNNVPNVAVTVGVASGQGSSPGHPHPDDEVGRACHLPRAVASRPCRPVHLGICCGLGIRRFALDQPHRGSPGGAHDPGAAAVDRRTGLDVQRVRSAARYRRESRYPRRHPGERDASSALADPATSLVTAQKDTNNGVAVFD